MIKKITSRFTRNAFKGNLQSPTSPSALVSHSISSSERHLLQRVTAGIANAADRAAASHLLGSDLDARDLFFELILEDAEFNQ